MFEKIQILDQFGAATPQKYKKIYMEPLTPIPALWGVLWYFMTGQLTACLGPSLNVVFPTLSKFGMSPGVCAVLSLVWSEALVSNYEIPIDINSWGVKTFETF